MGKAAELAGVIEAQIAGGVLGPGDTLPSEHELAARWGMARNTVRAALAGLAGRGLISSEKGIGWAVPRRVVLDIHLTRDTTRVFGGQKPTRGADSWVYDVISLGHTAAERLRIFGADGELGEPGVIRELLRLADDRPHNRGRWWFPRWVTAGTELEKPDPITGGALPYLATVLAAERLELAPVIVGWRMPRPDEAQVLAIPGGVPVAVETRRGFTSAGLVFASETIWPGDRARLIVEV